MKQKSLKFCRYDYASYAAFTMYSMCSLAIPLTIVAMGKSLNFPLDAGGMASGGILHAVRSIFMIIALVSCGLVAAKLGKRLTMGLSVAFFGTGILLCSLCTEYAWLFPCLVLAGLGEGVCEGIATPFIQDLHKDAPERYVNIGHSFWSIGIGCAVFIVGGLLTFGVNWRIIFAIIGLLSIASSAVFLWKENPLAKYPESNETSKFSEIIAKTKIIVRKKSFWICSLGMFFGAGAEFGLTFWSAAYMELTFHTGAFVSSLGTGAIALGMFFGRAYFGYIATPSKLRYILLFCGAGTIPVTLLMAFLKPGIAPVWLTFVILFVLLFLSGIGIAPYWPTMQVYGVQKLPECDSTLLYIYFSAMGIPGCGFFSWLMGAVGDKFGTTGTIAVVPCCLIVFLAVVLYECWYRKDKKS